MRQDFASSVMRDEIARGTFGPDDSFVAICAGQGDQALFEGLGLPNVTLTNIDIESGNVLGHTGAAAPAPETAPSQSSAHWEQADAQAMPYEDGRFDVAFVSDGLHHCRSPHLAVTEMYRVARKAVVVIESRDSAVLRAAMKARMTFAYEFNGRLLQGREHGGVDFGPVPNFVYRWTEREFEKLLSTYDPAHVIDFSYHHGLSLPKRLGAKPGVNLLANGVARVVPRQANTFAMVAKRGELKPYLHESGDGALRLRDDVKGPKAQLAARPGESRHHVVR
jgi:SAM-dependent methyltransferase